MEFKNIKYKDSEVMAVIKYTDKNIEVLSKLIKKSCDEDLLLCIIGSYFYLLKDLEVGNVVLVDDRHKISFIVEKISNTSNSVEIVVKDILPLNNVLIGKGIDFNNMNVGFSKLSAKRYFGDDKEYSDDELLDSEKPKKEKKYSNNIIEFKRK